MLTRNHRQEALSRAYVRAIAAQAGVTVSEPENDYGIDMSLRVITLRDGRRRDVGPQLDLQLKSTSRAEAGGTSLAYDLDVINYDDLRDPSGPTARVLVVLLMPEDESRWVGQSAEELTLRNCAYRISLKGRPPTPATTTVRVHVPLVNVFSAAAVQGIMQRLKEATEP